MDPNAVQIGLLVVQILTLIAIIIYVWKTWTMAEATRRAAEASQKALEEMRKTREEESRPYVFVFFRPGLDGTTLRFVISNVGRLPAKNVTFSFHPELKQGSWCKEPISQSPRLKEGIASLLPGIEFSELFDVFLNLKEENLPSTYHVTIRYQHPIIEKEYEEHQVLEWKWLTQKLGGADEWYRLAKETKDLLEKVLRAIKH